MLVQGKMNKISKCRFCNAELSKIFVDLGKTPLANSFLNENNVNKDETIYPLRAFVCEKCFLVQLEEYEKPQNIFSDYAYFSSYSETWLDHAKDYVKMMLKRFKINQKSQVVEIASNDGYLLQYFKKKGSHILGIEPATNVAKVAKKKGIPTLVEFFGTATAKRLVEKGMQADLIVGNNVLAHVPNLNDFVKGLQILLKPNGIITMEFPHLLKLIQYNQFDTIYHEHFSYFSLLTVQKIFSFHGMTIFDVEELTTHGGSLRIFAKHEENATHPIDKKVKTIIKNEEEFGLGSISTYESFSDRAKNVKKNLLDFITTKKKEGKMIVCYGAPAKGNTLLNYCGINSAYINYTVDRSPHKQGLYLPGTHIPIKNPEKIRETKPDFILILPWNLKEEIMSQLDYVHSWNCKFVVPIPEVMIYS